MAFGREVALQLLVFYERTALEMTGNDAPIRITADELIRIAFVDAVAGKSRLLPLVAKLLGSFGAAFRSLGRPFNFMDCGDFFLQRKVVQWCGTCQELSDPILGKATVTLDAATEPNPIFELGGNATVCHAGLPFCFPNKPFVETDRSMCSFSHGVIMLRVSN